MTEHTTVVPEWLSDEGMQTLSAGYLLPGETPRAMFERVARTASNINEDPSLFDDLFACLWRGWIGLASPVAANFGTSRALPISCYSVHLSDSVSSIYSHLKEVAQLSKNGGGVGVYMGDVRPAGAPISGGGKSTGIVPWAQQYDLAARVVSQGGVRRGSFAIYLPIDHPDVPELLRSKDHSKGDPRKFVDSNVALTVSDEWIESMIAGDVEKQKLFGEVLKTRLQSGSPYLVFIDNANRQNPQCYVDRGLTVKTSNLCSEIFLHTDENHTFVCVLSSLNLARYDEYKTWVSPSGRTVPQLAVHLLDAVVSEFIRKAQHRVGLGRALKFAEKSRALGLGTMGLHTLYQKRGLPFRSEGARSLNIETHRWIRSEAEIASRELAARFGEPEWCVGSGMRHTHLTAIAPTRTNSVISGAYSQGIEPIDANFFVAKQAQGSFVRKNPVLEKLFCDRGVCEDVWDSILAAKGSVQHLPSDILSDTEKEVFLTAREIDQFELVKQAADRQPFVCQGQSLNLFVDPEASAEHIFRLHLSAWRMGLKSLYYLKSSSLLTKRDNTEAVIVTKEGCPWCDRLKNELIQDDIKFSEFTKSQAVAFGLWNSNLQTVPQLWMRGKHVGGYTDYINTKSLNASNSESAECEACHA